MHMSYIQTHAYSLLQSYNLSHAHMHDPERQGFATLRLRNQLQPVQQQSPGDAASAACEVYSARVPYGCSCWPPEGSAS